MKEIKLNTSHCLISEEEIETIEKDLQMEINRMKEAAETGYDDDRASINLVEDEENVFQVEQLVDEKRGLDPSLLVVVGIGGSNLGTIAVQEALLGRLYNQSTTDLRILYADTVDADQLASICAIITATLNKGEKVILNGVSKSGGTIETMANFEVLVDTLKHDQDGYEEYVVVTTDKGSKFWDFAIESGFSVLAIPQKVGGRFSVFSSVGLFPLGMLGVDISDLMAGAKQMKERCLGEDVFSNPAALHASLVYLQKGKGKSIHDLFLFCTDFESIGKWFRQLMGESIGKEFDKDNSQVFEGITPTVSIGSVDLHSMAQLYLGGPHDKFTTFVRIGKNQQQVMVPDDPMFSALVPQIQGKSMQRIMDAILSGVQTAFCKANRPFVEIFFPDKSAYIIGQFLQLMMMEMMYLGSLMNVNPFDQPNVEAYKVETKTILETSP